MQDHKDTTVICYSVIGYEFSGRPCGIALYGRGWRIATKCLDGGYDAWLKSGYEVEKTVNTPQPSDRGVRRGYPGIEYILSIGEAKEKLAGDDALSWSSPAGTSSWEEQADTDILTGRTEPEGAVWGHDTDDGSYRGRNSRPGCIEGATSGESGASLDS